ncbi:MAG: DUF1467 family protein [Rhodobacteraceae bacterium]|nr:DUF1467 family protein [Paracoccaceae bacterium]
MSITGAIVLFATTWFLVFFVVLPLRFESQADTGDVMLGTPAGAPSGHVVVQKAKITTLVTLIVWGALVAVILSGMIGIRDIDFMGVMGPKVGRALP